MSRFKEPTYLADVAAASAEMATIPNRGYFSTGAADMTCFVERGAPRIAFDRACNTLSYCYRIVFVLDNVEYDFPLEGFIKSDYSRRLNDIRGMVAIWANHPGFPIAFVVQRFGDVGVMLNNIRTVYMAMQKEVSRIHTKYGI